MEARVGKVAEAAEAAPCRGEVEGAAADNATEAQVGEIAEAAGRGPDLTGARPHVRSRGNGTADEQREQGDRTAEVIFGGKGALLTAIQPGRRAWPRAAVTTSVAQDR